MMTIQKCRMNDALHAYKTMQVDKVELDFLDNLALMRGHMRGYDVTYAVDAEGSIGKPRSARMDIADIISQRDTIDIKLELDRIQFGKMDIQVDEEKDKEPITSYVTAGHVDKDIFMSAAYDAAVQSDTMDIRLVNDMLLIKGAWCRKRTAKAVAFNPYILTKRKKVGGHMSDIYPILYILKQVPDTTLGIIFYGNRISIESRHVMIVRSF